MAARTSTTQLLRQPSQLALGAVGGLTGGLLLVSAAWSWADSPSPVFAAWVLLGLAVVWSVFVRPGILLDDEGVTVRNVVRDVHIPWVRVTGVGSRWNVKVFVGDRGYASWAISSQGERPKRASGGMFAVSSPGRRDGFAHVDATVSTSAPRITASTVARLIEQSKREYDEAVALGQLPASNDATVRVTWVPLSLAVLLLPVIAVLVLSLT